MPNLVSGVRKSKEQDKTRAKQDNSEAITRVDPRKVPHDKASNTYKTQLPQVHNTAYDIQMLLHTRDHA